MEERPHDGRMSKFLMVSSVDQKIGFEQFDNMLVCLSLRLLDRVASS